MISVMWMGRAIESKPVSECPDVCIYPTQIAATFHQRGDNGRWRVVSMQPCEIYDAFEQNRPFTHGSEHFSTEAAAQSCKIAIDAKSDQTLEQWRKDGGVYVTPEWLASLPEFSLDRYIRVSLSLNVKNYSPSLTVDPWRIDPYYLGLWLGDGTSTSGMITSMDPEIVDFLHEYAATSFKGWKWHQASKPKNKASTYSLRSTKQENLNGGPFEHTSKLVREEPWRIDEICAERNANPLHIRMDLVDVLHNKHIPEVYFTASRVDRLQLLAGFIDTDGYLETNCYEIQQKSTTLADNLQRLVQELGFFMHRRGKLAKCKNGVTPESKTGIPVHRMTIFGFGLEEIPCKLPRKKWIFHDHPVCLPTIEFSATTPVSKLKRRANSVWTDKQNVALKAGIGKHGHGWAAIYRDHESLFTGFVPHTLKHQAKKMKMIE